MMVYNDDLSLKQLKNIKRKIVALVWESAPKKVIQMALFLGIKIPRQLLEKYISTSQE
jgi:hypothetical protein